MTQIPAGSVALYRICTEKSLLGFGKYADLPIGEIMKVDPEYVVWVYANKEKIALHKRILEKLGVREIKKPGIEPSLLYEYKDKVREGFTEEQLLHGRFARARGARRQAVARLLQAKKATSFTKGTLQAINHGHIKKK